MKSFDLVVIGAGAIANDRRLLAIEPLGRVSTDGARVVLEVVP